MRELHEKKYIVYKPSFNPYEGSEVILPDLSSSIKNETSSNFAPRESNNELVKPETRLNFERTELKNSQLDEQVHIYNNKTLENNIKTIYIPQKKIEENKSEFIAPAIELIRAFFQEKKVSTIEAEKYFNYYSSNGWKVGGKTPMKDWQAAARNWILNLDKFKTNKLSNQLSPKNLNISNNKDYAEPL